MWENRITRQTECMVQEERRWVVQLCSPPSLVATVLEGGRRRKEVSPLHQRRREHRRVVDMEGKKY